MALKYILRSTIRIPNTRLDDTRSSPMPPVFRAFPNSLRVFCRRCIRETLIHSDGDICLQGTQVSELREFRSAFCFRQKSHHTFNSCVNIMSYKGDLQQPKWLDVERCTIICYWIRLTLTSSPASFSTLCTIHPEMSELLRTLHPKRSALDQSDYYDIGFEVVMLFGLTELKAQISWKHKVCALFSLI